MRKTLLVLAVTIISLNVAKAQMNVASNGNVMIGSTSATPITPLHVLGSTYLPFGNSYWIGSTNDAGQRLRLHNDGQNTFIDFYANLFFRYGSASSDYSIIFHSNGCMSIGYGYWTPNPSYPLQVNGYILANGQLLPSDSRLKKNVESLSNNKSNLLKLKGVKFDYNSDVAISQTTVDNISNTTAVGAAKNDTVKNVPTTRKISPDVSSRKHFGFIAQDLQKIYPELVFEDKDGLLSVDYTSLIPMLVEAIKEQDSILTVQSAQIKELQKSVKK
jgi:hypothetical protein